MADVPRARPVLRGEEGATVLIMTLALLTIMTMLALIVDIGAALVVRRKLVTAADSSALAAAQSCAHQEGQTVADDMAAQYARANAGSGVQVDQPRYTPGCYAAAGTVTVVVHGDQPYFFAPAVGLPSSKSVSARAVAVWGGVGGGSFVPFMLSWGQLLYCNLVMPNPNEIAPGTKCTFWMNNKVEEMGNSQWAMLNLNTIISNPQRWGWNVPRDYGSCLPANTQETIDWIQNGSPYLSLNYPAPTFVCVDTGATPNAFKEFAKLAGQFRLFPVNDPDGRTDPELEAMDPPLVNPDPPHGQVNKTGEPCPTPCEPGSGPPGYNGPLDKYDIVGFAYLKIISVLEGGPSPQPDIRPGDEECGQPQDSNGWCLSVEWWGYYTDTNAVPTEGRPFNVLRWWLIE